jgi:hypothetical protein
MGTKESGNINAIYRLNKARIRKSIDRRMYRVFHFEVSISAPRLDLGSKSQQILTLARARSIWNFQPLGTKATAMLVDFSDALDVKPAR